VGVFRREEEPLNRAARRRAARPRAAISLPVAPSAFVPAFTPYDALSYGAPRAMTAAAAQINLNDKGEAERFRQRRSGGSDTWQQEAWEYYDAIGEVKYAFTLVASVVSRIRLYAGFVEDPSQPPMPIRMSGLEDARLASAAERALVRLDSAYGGQAGLLRDFALNLSVAGECYLVQRPEQIGSGLPESWDVRSVDELSVDQRGSYRITPRSDITQSSGQKMDGSLPLPRTAFVGRVWKAHPRYSDEADSSMRGILDLCSELLLLNRTFRATARSRLNAGALYLPDGLSVSAGGENDYPYADDDLNQEYTVEEQEDQFETQLIDAMTTPIRDEDSASAVVPLIIRGPAELGDKIKQFKFERSFDDALVARADRVLERILQGLDVPKDVVTGLANVKYSNALQIDESLYKAHIEPLMLVIVDALTVVYLRPYLLASGFAPADVERVCVWYDPSQVATRNDRAADADSGFDKMAVSYDAWRRAHGFTDADSPSPTELALRLMIEKGAITPELTESILGAVAPEVMAAARSASQASSVAPIPPDLASVLQGGQPTPAAPAEEPATETEPTAPSDEPAPTTEGEPSGA
jgi:hypothetical protein